MIFDNLVKVISGIYRHRVLKLQYQFFGNGVAERDLFLGKRFKCKAVMQGLVN